MERDFLRYVRNRPDYQSLVQMYADDATFQNYQDKPLTGTVYNHTEFNLHVDVFPNDAIKNDLLRQYMNFKRWQRQQHLKNNTLDEYALHSGVFNSQEYNQFL